MNKNLTDITIILDRSGSMESIKQDTIGGFNGFLESQKSEPGEANISLTQFDHDITPIYTALPLKEAHHLNNRTFIPRGTTSLLDAMGITIAQTGERLAAMSEKERPSKVIMVIITDGEENTSKEYTNAQVKKMVDTQTETYNWEFMYLGANQDAIIAARNMGIAAGNSLNYDATKDGVDSVYRALSATMSCFRSGEADSGNLINEDN